MAYKIEISWKTIVFTVFFLLSLWLLWLNMELIYALFLAFILMSGLKPIVGALERRRVPRSAAAVGVFLSFIAALFFILSFVIPPIVSQSYEFFTNLPILLNKTFPFLNDYLNFDSALRFFPSITENFFKVVGGIFSNFLFIVSVLFFSFYFLLEEKFLHSFIHRFVGQRNAHEIEKIVTSAEIRLGAWIRGELVLMTVIGVLTYIGLAVLGVPYALSLAVLAGLLEIVPIIGPIISAVPSFLVAASSSFFLGSAVAVLYLIIQQLENNIIVPYVMNKTVGIHPITTLIALSIGGQLGGVLGAILAVPVALVIETVIGEVVRKRS